MPSRDETPEPVKVTFTIEVPQSLVIALHQTTLDGMVDQQSKATQGFMDFWTQAGATFQKTLMQSLTQPWTARSLPAPLKTRK